MSSEEGKPSSTTEEEYKPFPDSLMGTGQDVTPDKDGGVLKAIRKEGDTTETDRPLKGDKVFVHYVGTLTDGSLFDSSRSRGDQFSFTLGQGQVIKAWDMGVATMRRGEIAVLTCKPEYAYGKASKPKIPADSTLVFEVELFDWQGEDLTPDHDEGVVRRIFVPGEGYDNPNEEAKVEVHIIGTYAGREFENRDVEFIISEGKDSGIVEGVLMALQKMKKGEVARLKIKPNYGYGSDGSTQYDIPANAELQYDVMLKTFEKAKEVWEMNIDEKLEASETIKAKGTHYFKKGRYDDAVKQWKKIPTYLETESSLDGETKIRSDALLLAANLNVAMATIKIEDFVEAIECCDKAIQMDSSSVKGYFRRGQALYHMAEYERSKVDFLRVLELEPENKAAKNQLSLSNQKIKQHHEKEKQLYGNMFARFAQQDEREKLARERARGDLEVGVFAGEGEQATTKSEDGAETEPSQNGVVVDGETPAGNDASQPTKPEDKAAAQTTESEAQPMESEAVEAVEAVEH